MDLKEIKENCKNLLGLIDQSKKAQLNRNYETFLSWFNMANKRNLEILKKVDKQLKVNNVTIWNGKKQLKSVIDFKRGETITFKRIIRTELVKKINVKEPVINLVPKLMTGSLWFVNNNADETEPYTLNEFKNNANKFPDAKLERGNLIAKSSIAEQHIIFDCIRPDDISSFKLFIYEDGSISGRVNYPIDYEVTKDYFKGKYKKISETKIVIWGVWSPDINLKEKYLTYIELSK